MKLILLLLISSNILAINYQNVEQALAASDFDTALELVNQLDKNDPDYKKIDYIKALVAMNKGDLDQAEEYIESALELNSEAKIYNLAGGIYGMQAANVSIFSKLGYAKKSKKYLLKAYQAEPDNKDYIIGLLMFNMQAPGIAGGDSDQIEPLLKELEKMDLKSAVQIRTQYIAEEEGKDEALNFISVKVIEHPDDLDYRFFRAFLYSSMEQYQHAYEDYKLITAQKPADWETNETWRNSLYQLGKLASTQNKWLMHGKTSFIEYLTLKNTKNSPPHAWASYRLGLIYQHLQQPQLAQESFMQSLAMNPDKQLQKLLDKLI